MIATLEPHHIVVFRALNLGDMLCAVPAFRALRQNWPRAHIALVGLPGAKEFVQRFSMYIDELIEFPGIPEFPEQKARVDELPGFYRAMKSRDIDFALQMHGSGRLTNAIVAQFGAKAWGGFTPFAHDEEPARLMAWPAHMNEVHTYLALLRFMGLNHLDDAMEFPISAEDETRACDLARESGLDMARTVLIHPGARLESRRWPAERFAKVAAALARDGWQVAVTGSAAETALAAAIKGALGDRLTDLCARTSLGALAGLIKHCRLLVCNDTGVSHVAAAMATPSVVIASGSDVQRWAPLNVSRHRVLSHDEPCRPCSHFSCPIGHPCALAITPEQVIQVAREQSGFRRGGLDTVLSTDCCPGLSSDCP